MSALPAIYPRERIPKNAVLTAGMFRTPSDPVPASFLDVGCSKFVSSGSMAIRLCLTHAAIGAGDTVLLPAYHCISMVEPVVWRGATPRFYRIHDDTSIDLADVRSKLDRSARALIVPHYFGFAQDAGRIREFCDRHGLIYVEDCAHAFFGSHADRPLGAFGDYAIASPWKFFPTFDGGLLASSRIDLDDARLAGPGAYYHCKAALNALEYAFDYGRLGALKIALSLPLRAKSYLWRNVKTVDPEVPSPNTQSPDSAGEQCSRWHAQAMSWPSRLTIALAATASIAARRRRNYQKLEAALRGSSGCRALFSGLPDAVVPQVFPLLVDDPDRVFPQLKHAGVPIIRFGEFLWPGVDERTCPQTMDLSRRVLQFPCHQDLRPEELDWMIATIHHVVEHR
ncbi:MAG: DegT/DnrJ/EryC1/StrS aminotransferase family protein [Burkholderiales bacterium]|nr:DegT/DnrJ/EryC1/StrS aminotransferase family protein [Burkholderiales bacterium]